MSEVDVEYSIETLIDAGYASALGRESNAAGETYWTGLAVTGKGLEILGEWPGVAMIAEPEAFAALLEQLGASTGVTTDDTAALRETSSSIRRLSGPVLRSAVTGVVVALTRTKLGL